MLKHKKKIYPAVSHDIHIGLPFNHNVKKRHFPTTLPASKASRLLAAVHRGDVHLILGLVFALPPTHVAGEDVVLLDVAVSAYLGPGERKLILVI